MSLLRDGTRADSLWKRHSLCREKDELEVLHWPAQYLGDTLGFFTSHTGENNRFLSAHCCSEFLHLFPKKIMGNTTILSSALLHTLIPPSLKQVSDSSGLATFHHKVQMAWTLHSPQSPKDCGGSKTHRNLTLRLPFLSFVVSLLISYTGE